MATTRMVVSVAAIGMIAVLAACAQVGTSAPDPAAPSPGRSSPDATSSPTGSDPAPGRPVPPPVDRTPVDAPPLGLDVRYIDEDGNFQVLRVRDFSR
jgi:hypothetical protein